MQVLPPSCHGLAIAAQAEGSMLVIPSLDTQFDIGKMFQEMNAHLPLLQALSLDGPQSADVRECNRFEAVLKQGLEGLVHLRQLTLRGFHSASIPTTLTALTKLVLSSGGLDTGGLFASGSTSHPVLKVRLLPPCSKCSSRVTEPHHC